MSFDPVFPLPLSAGGGASLRVAGPREEDREAIQACQRGEREAFDRLVERYQRDVYRLSSRARHDRVRDSAGLVPAAAESQ